MRGYLKLFTLISSVAFTVTGLAIPNARADGGTAQAETTTGGIHTAFRSPMFGGTGGSVWGIACTKLRSIVGRSGTLVDQLGLVCEDGSATPVGGGGGGPFQISCPSGFYASGIYGSSGSLVDSLGLFCKDSSGRVRMTHTTGGTGGSYFEYECPDRMFLTGFNVRKGSYIDAIQALCLPF